MVGEKIGYLTLLEGEQPLHISGNQVCLDEKTIEEYFSLPPKDGSFVLYQCVVSEGGEILKALPVCSVSTPLRWEVPDDSIELSTKYLVESTSMSRGNQAKWCKDGLWYKQDSFGYEGLVEEMTSRFMKCVQAVDCVQYSSTWIKRKNLEPMRGCVSANFLLADSEYVSIDQLINLNAAQIQKNVKHQSTQYHIAYLLNYLNEVTGIDLSGYLLSTLLVDAIILNEDRHMKNLGVLYNRERNTYQLCPLFDHGLSLLSDVMAYASEPIAVSVARVKSRPFSTSFDKQVSAALELHKQPLLIDNDMLHRFLDSYTNEIYPEHQVQKTLLVLKYNLERTEGRVWIRN